MPYKNSYGPNVCSFCDSNCLSNYFAPFIFEVKLMSLVADLYRVAVKFLHMASRVYIVVFIELYLL